MKERVGTCSNCGGAVMREMGPLLLVGAWPPDRCNSCGAVRADQYPVIPMAKPTSGKGYTEYTLSMA